MTEYEKIIARLARVIFSHAVGLQHWENEFCREERAGCERTARAVYAEVLAALEEPTGDMLRVAPAERPGQALEFWRTMIRAAPSPPSGGTP